MAGFSFKSKDPFVQHAYNIAMQHYGGRVPAVWASRINGELQKSPEGRALAGAFSTGSGEGINSFLNVHLPGR